MATETKSSVVRVKPSHQDGSSKAKVDSSSANKKKIESSNKQPVDSKQKSVTTVVKTEVKPKTASASASASAKSTKTTTKVREKKVYTLPGQKYDPPEEREPLRIFYESLSQQIPTSEMAEFWKLDGASMYIGGNLSKKSILAVRLLVGCSRHYDLTCRQAMDSRFQSSLRFPFSLVLEQSNPCNLSFILFTLLLICIILWMMEHGLLSPERAKKAYEKKQRRQKQLRMGTPIKSLKPPSKPQSSQKQQQASKNGILKAKKRIINDSDDDDDEFILSPKRRKG
ncbi:hypothetical protein I3760_08G026000 [Carya illinoinensis]|nr:hypothetical protein I3760_08G026000 [Carya illinoinensis]